MLLLNKTLLKLARGLWGDILAIAAVSFLALVGSTALSEIVAGFLGSLFAPADALSGAGDALRAALLAAAATFAAQLLKGLLEYRTAARARTRMRQTIFSKVMALDAGGIEQIGPTAAITASVDAVEQMQSYYSIYLPNLFRGMPGGRILMAVFFVAALFAPRTTCSAARSNRSAAATGARSRT